MSTILLHGIIWKASYLIEARGNQLYVGSEIMLCNNVNLHY